MSVAHSINRDHTVRYRLRTELGQVKLRLWEPAIKPQNPTEQLPPYVYLANFTFPTIAEAEAYLRNHLLENGAFDLPETTLPAEGEIKILPHPTWGLDSN